MDCGLTPQILVDAGHENVDVPAAFVQNGTIILNVHDRAVRDLNMDNEVVSFSARFSGVAHSIYVPMSAVMAVYARENGQGLFFDMPDGDQPEPTPPEPDDDGGGNVKPIRSKPNLKLV